VYLGQLSRPPSCNYRNRLHLVNKHWNTTLASSNLAWADGVSLRLPVLGEAKYSDVLGWVNRRAHGIPTLSLHVESRDSWANAGFVLGSLSNSLRRLKLTCRGWAEPADAANLQTSQPHDMLQTLLHLTSLELRNCISELWARGRGGQHHACLPATCVSVLQHGPKMNLAAVPTNFCITSSSECLNKSNQR
jgi:hypothetical protein